MRDYYSLRRFSSSSSYCHLRAAYEVLPTQFAILIWTILANNLFGRIILAIYSSYLRFTCLVKSYLRLYRLLPNPYLRFSTLFKLYLRILVHTCDLQIDTYRTCDFPCFNLPYLRHTVSYLRNYMIYHSILAINITYLRYLKHTCDLSILT